MKRVEPFQLDLFDPVVERFALLVVHVLPTFLRFRLLLLRGR